MLKPKPARTPQTTKSTRRFSLVSDDAQQQMYRALVRLATDSGGRSSVASGAEVAEIAVCLAAGERSPLILACSARGARIVERGQASGRSQASRVVRAAEQRLTAATIAAIEALLQQASGLGFDLGFDPGADQSSGADAETRATLSRKSRGKNSRSAPSQKSAPAYPVEAAAIVCAGRLDATPAAQRDYRTAFAFAARHKLPILYAVANRLAPEQGQPLDLRSVYPEFGLPLFTVDAADAIAAYRVATEALHNARHLRGPCIIEALTLEPAPIGTTSPIELLTAYMERHGNPPR